MLTVGNRLFNGFGSDQTWVGVSGTEHDVIAILNRGVFLSESSRSTLKPTKAHNSTVCSPKKGSGTCAYVAASA